MLVNAVSAPASVGAFFIHEQTQILGAITMKRKILSVLAAASLLAAVPITYAAKSGGDKVTLIVEAEGDALLASGDAALMGASLYNGTDAAKHADPILCRCRVKYSPI